MVDSVDWLLWWIQLIDYYIIVDLVDCYTTVDLVDWLLWWIQLIDYYSIVDLVDCYTTVDLVDWLLSYGGFSWLIVILWWI